MKPSIPDLKKQLVDEGADIDAMIAEFPEEETDDEKPDLATELDDAPTAVAPEIHALLMKYGPPDRWTVDIMKENKPDLLKKCSDAYDKMAPAEQDKIVREWEKNHNVNQRPPGAMTMRME